MADVKKKPHHFEIVMNSYSDGALNQEVIVREYANTPGELTLKQMAMTKDVIPKIVESFDKMSMPWQEQGMAEAGEVFAQGNGKGKKPAR